MIAMDRTPSDLCSELVAGILRADKALSDAGVTVLERRKGDWASEVEKAAAETSGPVALVCCDGASNARPGLELRHSVTVVETVALNRLREGCMTALDVAWRCIALLDGDTHHFRELRHDAPDAAHLEATAEFTTRFSFTAATRQ